MVAETELLIGAILLCYPIQIIIISRSQWPRELGRSSTAARLLRSWVRIPPGTWMFVCCKCCVLSGRCLCDELITCPEKSYRICCVVVCDLETSRMSRPRPALDRSATKKKLSTRNTNFFTVCSQSCRLRPHYFIRTSCS